MSFDKRVCEAGANSSTFSEKSCQVLTARKDQGASGGGAGAEKRKAVLFFVQAGLEVRARQFFLHEAVYNVRQGNPEASVSLLYR